MGKKIKLQIIKKVQGTPFREAVRDDSEMPILEVRKDREGNPVMALPRNDKGEAIPNTVPEPVYMPVTKELTTDALPTLLKSLYLRIPSNKLSRQDTIYGTRMFQNIEKSPKGYIELDEDVHKWIREKLQDEEIGIKIFGVDLYIVEEAVDDFERLHEGKEK